jgi:EAL domain-containing protein (putative c-di-GMP-specific phosphodiesterase class I)
MLSDELARASSSNDGWVSEIVAGLQIVLQPVIELATGTVLAVEALARFANEPHKPVEDVLAEAHAEGLGYLLEAACLRAALDRRSDLPDGVRLTLNLSPDALGHPAITETWDADLDGVIVEVTEHIASNSTALRDQLAQLRLRGAAIAVDDVGTGYAGLLRLASMRPDFVKIDATVVAGVRYNTAQSAVLEALVTFSHRMGAAVIGEGVETLEDLVALAEFDVDYGQGWMIGRPVVDVQPIRRLVVATCLQTRSLLLQRRAATSVSASYTHEMHAVTSAFSTATGLTEIQAAANRAATEIGIDAIGVSVLGEDGILREIVTTGGAVDISGYPVAEYPATLLALETGNTVEAHLSDIGVDPAEKLLLEKLGHASLLMIPLVVGDQPVGVLELAHRTHRRWTTQDIAHGRGLATHLSHALLRISG